MWARPGLFLFTRNSERATPTPPERASELPPSGRFHPPGVKTKPWSGELRDGTSQRGGQIWALLNRSDANLLAGWLQKCQEAATITYSSWSSQPWHLRYKGPLDSSECKVELGGSSKPLSNETMGRPLSGSSHKQLSFFTSNQLLSVSQ